MKHEPQSEPFAVSLLLDKTGNYIEDIFLEDGGRVLMITKSVRTGIGVAAVHFKRQGWLTVCFRIDSLSELITIYTIATNYFLQSSPSQVR